MSWKNRLKNLVVTPFRLTLGLPAHTVVDVSKTLIGVGKDAQDIGMKTANQIQETISDAGKKGKWYHTLFNIPVAGVGSTAKVATGSIGAVVNSVVNGVVNTAYNVRNLGWNFARILGSTFSSKPVSDFSFKKHALKPTWKSFYHPKNWLIGGTTMASVAATVPQIQATSDSDPKPVVDDKSKKTIFDLTQKFEQQEKANQELQKNMIAMKDQMEKQTQLMQQQLKQKDDMIAVLQKSHGEKNNNEKDSNHESPKKKASKNKQLV